MPKKPARNAFYFYMKDLEPQLKREGRVFPHGMADIVPIAHPRWKALPEAEKDRYEKIAKEYKAKMRGAEGDRYRLDNMGNILSERKDERVEMQKRRTKERNAVKSQWPPGKELADEKFYLLNIQTLCKTDDGDYLPCEIAAIEYSIKRGIIKSLHRFIEPGRIPTGYRYSCKSKSEDTHQIPIERFEKADANYRGLYIQLENFVNPNQENPEFPPFYCMGTDVEETEYCLDWIHGKSCIGYGNRLRKVYNLEGLVQDLFSHIGHSVSESQVIDILTAHTWDFEPKTRCDFHEELECKYCSLGFINRYAYAVSDSLCSLYGATITPKHLPIREEGSVAVVVLPQSSMRVDPNQDARLPPRREVQSTRPKQQPTFQPVQPQAASGNKFTSISRPDDSDEDDDEADYTALRRPHGSAFSGAGRGLTAMPQWSGVPNRAPAPPSLNDQSNFPGLGINQANFPSLGGSQPVMAPPGMSAGIGRGQMPAGIGRGVPIGQGDKFAGRALAPDPISAPIPPPQWQQAVKEPQKITMADISRGLQQTSIGPDRNGTPPSILYDRQNPMAQPMSRPQYNGTVQQPPRSAGRGMMGQFQGILGNLQKDRKLPVGRGYAPPGGLSPMVN